MVCEVFELLAFEQIPLERFPDLDYHFQSMILRRV